MKHFFTDSVARAIALSVRSLSMDAVQRANSGHPGLPMGLAELGATLYGAILSHAPRHPEWPNRDRFVLSAGHGSMLLYSLLHLSGYDVSLDDIRAFRKTRSRAPGHPEYGHTAGVETTTGPLGQGFANAVGMAIAERHLASVFNVGNQRIIDHYTYAIASDGDLMEGVAAEASSLAGHLRLGKLIVYYDDNKISIEGRTDIAFSEDVAARYRAYDWNTFECDARDWETLLELTRRAQEETERPTLIIARSIIGYGSPNKADTPAAHGSPLGDDEVRETKRNIGLDPDREFYVDPAAVDYFGQRQLRQEEAYSKWKELFERWRREHPDRAELWDRYFGEQSIDSIDWPRFKPGEKVATRAASGKCLQAAAREARNLVGGSADLAPSNSTAMPDNGDYSHTNRLGRTIHFGVREHGMGAICNGICVYGGLRVFCATFLAFADYMRGSIRLAALMGLPVIYIMTHDSILLGEDGPTHQPIEHLASLRAIPNLMVLRPGDAEETVSAWQMALRRTDGPTLLALTRQGIPVYKKDDRDWKTTIAGGAFIARDSSGTPERVVIATGSEVAMAIEALDRVDPALRSSTRVVSMISRELFSAMPQSFRDGIIPPDSRVIVAEAGIAQGWEHFAPRGADRMVLSGFGLSGPGNDVATALGMHADRLAEIIAS